MINIYTDGGNFLDVRLQYDIMLDFMKNDFAEDSDFIEFEFQDGTKGTVRKRSIIGFCESEYAVED